MQRRGSAINELGSFVEQAGIPDGDRSRLVIYDTDFPQLDVFVTLHFGHHWRQQDLHACATADQLTETASGSIGLFHLALRTAYRA
jgi:hypothetical protein